MRTDWLKQRAGAVKRLSACSMAATGISSVLLCAQAWLFSRALYGVAFAHRDWQTLWRDAAGICVLVSLRFALGLSSRHFGFRAGRQQVADIRKDLLAHVQALGPLWMARESSGVWVTRLIDGVEALEAYYARYLPQKMAAALLPVVILVAVFPADWIAGLVLLLTAPLVPLFMVLLGNAAQRASQRRWTVLTRLGAQFNDLLQGLVTLRLFGAGRRAQDILMVGSERYRRSTMEVLRVAFLSSLVLEFFATVSIAVVAVLVGFRLLWGEQVFSHAMFVLLLAPEFYLPLRGMGALRHVRMDALAIAEDAEALLSLPVASSTSSTSAASDSASSTSVSTMSIALSSSPSVRFERVSFAYPDGRGALHAIDAEFPAGKTTAVIGPSGAGKSTVLLLLLGLVRPQSGTIRVNGQAFPDLDDDGWRQRVAWVAQHPRLFAGSLRENIAMADPDADDDALRQAARRAGLDPVIDRLPGGWHAMLGENGHGLSGGETQRVALARALLRKASLVVLDEPTQQLDAVSARAIERVLAEMAAAGSTIIQVGHRMALAAQADHIVSIEAGRVTQNGAPGELASHQGLYAELLAAEEAAA